MGSIFNRRSMVLAATGILACLGVPAAHGDFILSVTSTVVGSDTDYVLSAQNNGLNGTGTSLLAVDCTLTTPGSGTTGAMIVAFTDIDGDSIPDANVIGYIAPIPPGTGQPDAYPNIIGPGQPPKILGTFIRVGEANFVDSALAVVPGAYLSSDGPLDPAYLDGTLHSLRVVEAGGKETSGLNGPVITPVLDVTPVAIANIVVPDGTSWTASGSLSGDLGAIQPFSITVPEPSSVALLGLGGIGLLNRRRRGAVV